MRSLALTVFLSACVQPQPDSGARYTLTHYLAEIRLEDRAMTDNRRSMLIHAIKHGYGDAASKAVLRRELESLEKCEHGVKIGPNQECAACDKAAADVFASHLKERP